MNELRDHPNLYLRQHGNNPIHWKEWNDVSWDIAQNTNKLVIISIGYSSCHWCHVMEKECFEDEEVALYTNENFVSIKVDRETRPDIDQIYMNAIHLMGKQGGWPLNCICLPDGTPLFGGTYFPKKKWLQILTELNDLFLNRKESLDSFAKEMKEALTQFEPKLNQNTIPTLDHDSIQSFIADLDFEWGGTNGFPKFPMPPLINAILKYGIHQNHKAALRWAKITLEKIKFGGIHDLVGGGISRYSVDHRWHVPHFEKMLFDNALLMGIYSEAALTFRDSEFEEVIKGIHDWITHEMKLGNGLVASTMDADSDGEEGKYYVFHKNEILELLEKKLNHWNNVFDFDHHSLWEEDKIVLSAKTFFSLKDEDWLSFKNNLQSIRNQKNKPTVDTKVITSWNAQLVIGYCYAAEIFPEWISFAENLFSAMKMKLYQDGKWVQGIHENQIISPLLFDTIAWLQKACIELFLKTTDWEYIEEAKRLYHSALPFQQSTLFYALNAKNDMIGQAIEIQDNVIPSSNAIWVENLYWLSIITGDVSYHDIGLKLIQAIGQDINHISYYAHWNYVLQLISANAGIVVASHPEADWKSEKKWLHKTIVLEKDSKNPFLDGKWKDKTQYSLCTLATCYPPVFRFQEIS